jgi:hypothetical protein
MSESLIGKLDDEFESFRESQKDVSLFIDNDKQTVKITTFESIDNNKFVVTLKSDQLNFKKIIEVFVIKTEAFKKMTLHMHGCCFEPCVNNQFSYNVENKELTLQVNLIERETDV